MSEIGQPFFFDQHIFDSDDPRSYEENKPEKPEFTSTELEAAKVQAFEEGRKAGIHENEASLTQSVVGLLQKLDRDMSVLFAAEDDRAKNFEVECLHLTTSIISKLFPVLNEKHGDAELNAAISKALAGHNEVANVRLEIHDTLLESLRGFLAEQNAGKNIALSENSALGLDEFRMQWPNGGLIVNRLKIADEIVNLMKETLAENGVNVHDEQEQITEAPEGEACDE